MQRPKLVERCGQTALALVLLFPVVSTAQVTVIMSGGFAGAYKELSP
jgi:hypothetical protein